MSGPDPKRLRVLGGLLLAGLVGVWVQVFRLQVGEHEHLARLAREQYVSHVRIPARRGHIYDQTGAPLAITVDSPSVFANPAALGDPNVAAKPLAKALGLPRKTLAQRLASGRYFVWLRRHVTPAMAQATRNLKMPGVGITEEPLRSYPNHEVAGHVVGMAGLDGRGLEGIEHQLDDELKGAPQMVAAFRDARGQAVMGGGQEHDLRARGADITLSLDLQIQHHTEQALKAALDTARAQAASAVVLDVATAEVLAMATVPGFNPADPASTPIEARRNRTLTDVLEPGSTLKPLVVASALDRGMIRPAQKIDCENGRFALRGHTINDTHPHQLMTPAEILAKSSNIGMAKIAQAMGRESLEAALRDFGLGARTHIEFPGEVPGFLRPSRQWSDLELATIAFGQGVGVNLVQLAAAYRVLAADGLYRAPRLVRSIRRPDGRQAVLPKPQERRVLGTEAARRVTRMLEGAVSPEGGTGRLAAVPGYRVGGKTGTAQKAELGHRGYSHDRYVALFGGYLPAEAPRVVIVVAIDEPKANHYGGVVAAPVFADIGAAAMQRLGVVATREEEVAQAPVTLAEAEAMRTRPLQLSSPVDAVRAAPPTTTETGSDLAARSDGQAVLVVANADAAAGGGMPSFLGMGPRQAAAQFVGLGMPGALTFTGYGRVVRQDPAPHVELPRGGGVHLVLAPAAPEAARDER